MKLYALTVKKTRKPITLDLYEDYLTWLATKAEVSNINYEDTRGLHVHCLITAPDDFQYNDLKILPFGWSFKMVPIYDLMGWLSYSEKDRNKHVRENLIMEELHENDPRQTSYIPTEWDTTRSAPKGSNSEEEKNHTTAPHGYYVCLSMEPSPQDYYKNGLDIRKRSS